jgi:hypothetical protein
MVVARALSPGGRARAPRGVAAVLVMAATVGFAAMAVVGVASMQQQRQAMDQLWLVERARAAARAGLAWGRWRATRAPVAQCQPATTLTLSGTLSAWRVTVRCSVTGSHIEGAATPTSYRLEATGCNAASCPGATGPGYAEAVEVDWALRP